MRLQYSTTYNEGVFLLQGDEFRHSVKVLRQRNGDEITIIDGSGTIYFAEIIEIGKKDLQARVIRKEIMLPLPYHLAIAIAPTKNPTRFEFFVEKAVEIGVSEIYPVITKRTEKFRVKKDRLEKIVISAMKQSGNIYQPIIHETIDYEKLLSHVNAELKLIASVEEETALLSSRINQEHQDFFIAIGPEGGFTEYERDAAKQYGFMPVSLGKSILRTETAGVVACQTIKTKMEWHQD